MQAELLSLYVRTSTNELYSESLFLFLTLEFKMHFITLKSRSKIDSEFSLQKTA